MELYNDKNILNDNNINYLLEEQDFNGPMELLLEMIEAAKIPIRKIFISDLTAQYLKRISEIKEEMDYEYLADFISMASKLLYLKTGEILPKQEVFDDSDYSSEYSDIEEEREAFFTRIEKYKLFKEISSKLAEKEALNRFYRDPEFKDSDMKIVVEKFSLDNLVKVFNSLLERLAIKDFKENAEPKSIKKETATVTDYVKILTQKLREYKEFLFSEVLSAGIRKIDMINLFLALLVLMKRQIATIIQHELFSDIIVKATEEFLNNDWEATENAKEFD